VAALVAVLSDETGARGSAGEALLPVTSLATLAAFRLAVSFTIDTCRLWSFRVTNADWLGVRFNQSVLTLNNPLSFDSLRRVS
jgi:hypothetical protein